MSCSNYISIVFKQSYSTGSKLFVVKKYQQDKKELLKKEPIGKIQKLNSQNPKFRFMKVLWPNRVLKVLLKS